MHVSSDSRIARSFPAAGLDGAVVVAASWTAADLGRTAAMRLGGDFLQVDGASVSRRGLPAAQGRPLLIVDDGSTGIAELLAVLEAAAEAGHRRRVVLSTGLPMGFHRLVAGPVETIIARRRQAA